MRVRLWIQQRHESPCALSFQGMGCLMMGGESDVGGGGETLGGGDNGGFRLPFVEGDDERVGDFGVKSIEEDEVSLMDGVLEGALGALEDDS
ncbi:hypothetical protein Tco_0679222 [Tanacetum coccineum]|uniref:Uncharacterized protein n=1 Tax=Tanacetum coccineum TaxID=301880 RepID=A0ABQ4XI75_9ASTR